MRDRRRVHHSRSRTHVNIHLSARYTRKEAGRREVGRFALHSLKRRRRRWRRWTGEERGEDAKRMEAKEDARTTLCLLITRRRHICIHVRATHRPAALTFSLNVIVCNNLMPPVSLPPFTTSQLLSAERTRRSPLPTTPD